MSSSESDIKRSMCIENISAHESENETYDHLAIDLELEWRGRYICVQLQ